MIFSAQNSLHTREKEAVANLPLQDFTKKLILRFNSKVTSFLDELLMFLTVFLLTDKYLVTSKYNSYGKCKRKSK
jgi:hypothetical protein